MRLNQVSMIWAVDLYTDVDALLQNVQEQLSTSDYEFTGV